jgi:excisionase family DNA binding protein
MAPRKKPEPSRTVSPVAVDRVLAAFRAAGGSGAGSAKATRARKPSGTVLRYDRPATLGEGEVVVMVLDRDMAVVRTLHRVAPGRRGAGARNALGAAALRLAEMELVASDVLAMDVPAPGDSNLTKEEDEALKRGGFDPTTTAERSAALVAEGAAEYASVLGDAVDVGEAAKLLGVNDSRIRQRLGERSLYGIKDGGAWRIPRFQFRAKRVVPSLPAVLPAMPAELHPVAVKRWLTTPNPDLPLGPDDEATSPLDWLASGGDPAQVVALAQGL